MDDLFADEVVAPLFGQYKSSFHPSGQGFIIHIENGQLIYIPQFIPQKIANRTLDVLLENNLYAWQTTQWANINDLKNIVWKNIQWKQDSIKIYGKTHLLPRLTAWYGEAGKSYTYSGIESHPLAWNKPLLWLKQQLEAVSQSSFNSVLLNWYRDGQDHLAWHDDAEAELGNNPTIGSLNFGASRRFLLRRKDNHNDKIELLLGHGDLLIMAGELQQYWQHCVPKQTKVKNSRINLTFRYIHPLLP
ncbi:MULTISPECIES: alpha-ketoglutarate-dependent dioxygenase AlkB [unclassified Acinetobacter]|uniref:alpha-ketoglutarate-dependent dioxygenase AlkB family protein n=1 Tax=unclassified Acinetobacter TaxID=196816 RepID=UPI0005C75394|nr:MULTISPECIES: alpha-ketoglutarate-dependent dioxygenase AlkB [unclassified Acinetobacter]